MSYLFWNIRRSHSLSLLLKGITLYMITRELFCADKCYQMLIYWFALFALDKQALHGYGAFQYDTLKRPLDPIGSVWVCDTYLLQ